MKNFIVAFAFSLNCFLAKAAETNLFYVTHDRHLDPAGIHDFVDSKKIEAAKTMRECLPAKDFPEGNWGEAQLGYQLSLRFDQPAYTNGSPVMTTLLLRNVTNKMVEYASIPVGWSDGPIGFEVTDSKGRSVSQHTYAIGHMEGQFTAGVNPQAQVKYLERLDMRFDLTNDTYFVQANVRVGDLVSIPEIRPILDSDGKFRPKKDEHGSMTNVIVTWPVSDSDAIATVKSAVVKIQVKQP